MKSLLLYEGTGRTRVSLSIQSIGKDLVVFIYNKQGHLGAVAMADYDHKEKRASTSVITRLGHKDDTVAYQAAYKLCTFLKAPVCTVAGLHVDNITKDEIARIIRNCETLIDRYIQDYRK